MSGIIIGVACFFLGVIFISFLILKNGTHDLSHLDDKFNEFK